MSKGGDKSLKCGVAAEVKRNEIGMEDSVNLSPDGKKGQHKEESLR